MSKKIQKQQFTYAVGHPWDKKDPDSSIAFYAYGREIFHGSIDDAEGFKAYCDRQLEPSEKKKQGEYRIYKVVELTAAEIAELHKPIKRETK